MVFYIIRAPFNNSSSTQTGERPRGAPSCSAARSRSSGGGRPRHTVPATRTAGVWTCFEFEWKKLRLHPCCERKNSKLHWFRRKLVLLDYRAPVGRGSQTRDFAGESTDRSWSQKTWPRAHLGREETGFSHSVTKGGAPHITCGARSVNIDCTQ